MFSIINWEYHHIMDMKVSYGRVWEGYWFGHHSNPGFSSWVDSWAQSCVSENTSGRDDVWEAVEAQYNTIQSVLSDPITGGRLSTGVNAHQDAFEVRSLRLLVGGLCRIPFSLLNVSWTTFSTDDLWNSKKLKQQKITRFGSL